MNIPEGLIPMIPLATVFLILCFSKNKSEKKDKIELEGETFYFSTKQDSIGGIYTVFYTRTLEKQRSWCFCEIPLFGPKISVFVYKPIFQIDYIITWSGYSKDDVKSFITEGYKKYQRKLEIERGEII